MSRHGSGCDRMARPGDVKRDLDEELAFHFEQVVEELMEAGSTRAEAEAEAKRRFGDEGRYRRELERIDRGVALRRRLIGGADAGANLLKQAVRSLVRSRGLSVGIVLAFALGIGANATMFGIVDRLLLSPPGHVRDPDAVKRVVIERRLLARRLGTSSVAYPDYRDFESVSAFEGVAAYSSRRRVMVGRGAEAVPAMSAMVTSSYWDVLGVRAVVGRLFAEEEDRIGAAGTIVLGWGLWQRMFGGDAGAVGRTIDFGQGPYTIVGVTPRGFTGVDLEDVDLWLPARTAWSQLMGANWFEGRGGYWLSTIVRLAPGASAESAEAQATAVHREGRREEIARQRYDAEVRVLLRPLIAARGAEAAAEPKVAKWLAGVSAIVLLIACVNVANLLLARAVRQRREVGIRLALGVSRARLVGQTLVESVLLAMAGAAAALIVARFGGSVVRRTLLPDVVFLDDGLGVRTAVYAFALAALAGIVSALAPAISAARGDVTGTLRASAGGITRSTLRARGFLTVAQAALSVVLLVGAGLFLRSLRNVETLDLGFSTDGLLWVRLVEEPGAFTAEERLGFFQDAAERLRGSPGVRSATYARGAPFYTSYVDDLRAEGLDSIPRHDGGGPYVHVVGPDYLITMGMRVTRGRTFEGTAESGAGPLVALVNEAMAKALWPDAEAIGRCLYIGQDADACTAIIGVVGDARRSVTEAERVPQYFIPMRQAMTYASAERLRPEMLLVRSDADVAAVTANIQRTLLGMSARLRYVNVASLSEQLVEPQLRSWRLGATMFTVFGALALLVAALGLHSVLAFDVAQRTREIGLRSALGADTSALLGLVVGRAVRMALFGVALGLLSSALLAPRLEALLYATSPHDPATFLLVALTLLAVAALASGAPALRAAHVDPNVALRSEC